MAFTRSLRVTTAAAIAVLVAATASPAGAVTPPDASIGAAPPDSVGPERPVRKNNPRCVEGGTLPASNLTAPPQAASTLQLDRAHEFSTGSGVTVAVISTGVRPQPRLAGVLPGGDYVVESENGLVDCDAVGTLVAGIIGAKSSPADGFVGVAPDSRILSLRVESSNYQPQAVDADNDNPNTTRQALTLRAVARAIVRAANHGAKVIVVPAAICIATNKQMDQRSLGGALAFAASKDAVVVAGAGAVGREGGSGAGCKNNPDADPAKPIDRRGWDRVDTISAPGWFDPLVLTVGAVSGEGTPLANSMIGPWIDVAAPGSGLVSLSPNRGDSVINGVQTDQGLQPFAGPEFAAAYVAGAVALVRSRWPQLNAQQAAARVIATAHSPAGGVDNQVGNGLIDPVAALTASIPAVNAEVTPDSVAALIVPPPPPQPDTKPRIVAAAGIGGAIVVMLLIGGTLALRGRQGTRKGTR